IILDEEDIKKAALEFGKDSKGNAVEQILTHLIKRGFFPLRYNSWQLPYLLRIMGYCFGDGLIYFAGKKKHGTVCFYGQKKDLRKIKEDVKRLGFEAGLYSRSRHHRIKTSYEVVEFDAVEDWLKVGSSGFAVLLAALGVPVGNKCRNPYQMPKWLFKAPLWHKRLFLAGLFGAEMSSPKTLTGHAYNFYCPTVSMNKIEAHIENGKEFLEDIRTLLLDFGIATHQISQRKEFVNKDGLVSHRLRLLISDKTENLIKLYSKIGFEYNQKRRFLANAAAGYLRLKKRIIEERKQAMLVASTRSKEEDCSPQFIYNALTSEYVSQRFLERSLYESSNRGPRMWGDDPTFEEYLKKATEGLGKSGMIWERVEHLTDLEYNDYVYDFTVAHKDHNFLADGFVVSNCGVRLVRTCLTEKDVRPRLKDLVVGLFNAVPAGVGSEGDIRATLKDEKDILLRGSGWAVKKGYGIEDDLDMTEERGAIDGADPEAVSERAYTRGKSQSGTLGSGNHFLEVQVVDQLYDADLVSAFGLKLGQVVVMIHSGSRGLGYQVCDDSIKAMLKCLTKYNINVDDRQLASAPVNSPEGKEYLGGMRAAANYAWNNRQCLMHLTRVAFEKIFGASWEKLGMFLIYDVAHNIAKIEKHVINGKERLLCVHRKGATRAFGPGHAALPDKYKKTGQPVIIPGDMGRNSYLLVGTEQAMQETFGTVCHGAGRLKSRHEAKRTVEYHQLLKELEAKGIVVMASGHGTIVEEAPSAYKDVNEVVDVVHNAGLAHRVARMRPIGVIKG
ncbi:MAG: RtcB family protein, partial [Candidatus Omnitrophota bacterium]